MSKLFRFVRAIGSFIFNGEIVLALYNISLKTPNWFFKFNKATILHADKLIFPQNTNPNIKVKIADYSDHDEIQRISKADKSKIKQLMDGGVKCFMAAYSDKKYSSLAWVSYGKCYIKGMGYYFDLDENCQYSFWLYTAPESRKMGINTTLLSESYEYALNNNIRKFYIFVEFLNEYALKYHVKLGYIPTHNITYIKIFFIKINIKKPISTKNTSIKIFIKEPKGNIINI